MLYPTYPQPYGSELSVDVKCGFWRSRFLFPDTLNPDTCANLCFPIRRVSQLGAWFKIGFFEQLLINPTISVPPQPAQELARQFRLRPGRFTRSQTPAGMVAERELFGYEKGAFTAGEPLRSKVYKANAEKGFDSVSEGVFRGLREPSAFRCNCF
jgi:hypothetical protein